MAISPKSQLFEKFLAQIVIRIIFLFIVCIFNELWHPWSKLFEFLPKEYSSQVSRRFIKYFLSYHAANLIWAHRGMGRHMDSGNDNPHPAFGPMGKNHKII